MERFQIITKLSNFFHPDHLLQAEVYKIKGGAEYLSGNKENACRDWALSLKKGCVGANDLIKTYCK